MRIKLRLTPHLALASQKLAAPTFAAPEQVAATSKSKPSWSKTPPSMGKKQTTPMYADSKLPSLWLAGICLLCGLLQQAKASETGKDLYQKQCSQCHGIRGEGVSGKYDDPFSSDLSRDELTEVIAATMPEGEPEACQGAEAEKVASYILDNLLVDLAKETQASTRPTLSRLTGEQLRQSLADLYGHFQGNPWTQNERGVAASYFEGSRWSKDKLKLERTDPTINFDFGKEDPIDGVPKEEFFIQWLSSLKVDHSGRYEIILRSSLSCMMKFGASDRVLVNNHVQSAGKEEFRRTLFLTAGRVYPFSVELIQRKRKTEQPPAVVSLSWIPPSGIEEVIPSKNLIPNRLPATFSVQTKLPPDDRSYGYERGTSVNRQWDDSTTKAAIEFAEVAKSELFPQYRRSHKDIPRENREDLRSFLQETLETALRGPLSDESKSLYIDQQLASAEDDGEAIKRSILFALKSPRFLYPTIDSDRSTSQRRANRLALVLYDSLPADPWLSKLVDENKLDTQAEARQAATKMMRDYRAQAKIRSFIYQWLDLGDLTEITKDSQLYPGFDSNLVHQLKGSLDAMIDQNLKDGGDFRQLMLADWVMTTPDLHQFYGDAWAPEITQAPTPNSNPAEAEKEPKNENEPEERDEAEETDASSESTETAELPPDAEQEPTATPPAAPPMPTPASFVRSVRDKEVHAGILSHPLIMSHLAYFRTSSPIHRGVFLTRYTLGRVLRPPNEAFTPINPELHPNLTTRQRVELQTGEVSCQVCHRKINSLGFALEAFDAVGRFRKEEKQQTVNTLGSYQARRGETVTFDGARELAEYLANSPDAHEAFVESAFEHFVKQPINAYREHGSEKLTEFFQANDFSIEKLVIEIALVASELEANSNDESNSEGKEAGSN